MASTFRPETLPWLGALAGAVLALSWAGGGGAQETPVTAKRGLKVTVLLYSGRTNPAFVLDDEESIGRVRALLGSAKALEAFKKGTVVPSVLGYNGLLVQNVDGTVARVPSSLIVHKGAVEVTDDRKRFLADDRNELEKLLLARAVASQAIDEATAKKILAGR